MRCGWMRPSSTSFSSVSRAVSLLTGSKHDSSTASGVSSMIRLTPVVDSNARMLRPSRPMIRPFISSPGRCSTLTTDSAVCSAASRCTASVTIFVARFSPSLRAAPSISLMISAASRLAWFSISLTSSFLACSPVSPATRSRMTRRSSSTWSSSSRRSASSTSVSASFLSRSDCRLASSSSRCSRSASLASRRSRSERSSLSSDLSIRLSSSTSRRICAALSAAASDLRRISSASVSALCRISRASSRACSSSSCTTCTCSALGLPAPARGWLPEVRRMTTRSAAIIPNASTSTATISTTTSGPMYAPPSSRRQELITRPQNGRGHRRAAQSPVGVFTSIDVKPRLTGRRLLQPTPRPPRSSKLVRPSFTGMAIRAARSNSSLPSRLCVEQVTSKQTRHQACLTGPHLHIQPDIPH